jgi:hypothetical protein
MQKCRISVGRNFERMLYNEVLAHASVGRGKEKKTESFTCPYHYQRWFSGPACGSFEFASYLPGESNEHQSFP